MNHRWFAFVLGFLFTFSLLFSCRPKEIPPSAATLAKFEQLQWLNGDWEQFNQATETKTVEAWKLTKDLLMEGTSTVTKGTDSKIAEKMELSIEADSIYFMADLPHNKKKVFFKLTDVSAESFTVENPEHDYPQKIVYTRIDDGYRLKVQTFGGGKRVDYNFFRVEK